MITVIPAAMYKILCPVCICPVNFAVMIPWHRITNDEIWQALKKYLIQKLLENIAQAYY